MRPIIELARERLGIGEEFLESYGRYKAKISLPCVRQLKGNHDGKLVLVTAISLDLGRVMWWPSALWHKHDEPPPVAPAREAALVDD